MENTKQRTKTGTSLSNGRKRLGIQGRTLSRRTLVKSGLIGGGALLATLYIDPSFKTIRPNRAYAAGLDSGCTPGKWKNNTDIWGPTGYLPGDDWDTTFGVDAFNPDLTLLEALKQGGGGVKALGRHATAALLNAAHPGIAFPFTVAEVISLVQAALAGTSSDLEETKNLLDAKNNLGCPETLTADR